MSRPRTVKRMLHDLLDEFDQVPASLADDLAMAPNRLKRLFLRPQIIAVSEERRLRDLHRCSFPGEPDTDESENEPCPPKPTPSSPPSTESPTSNTASASESSPQTKSSPTSKP